MSRRLTFWRWFRRLVLGLLALVIATLLFAMIALQTDWGQRQIKRQVEAALAKSFTGPVAIDRLEVGLSGSVELEGLRIGYGNGEPAAAVERLSITCDFLPLLSGKIRCSELRVVGPRFWHRPNAGPLLRPSEEKTEVDLEIASASLEGGRVEIEGAEVISGIAITLASLRVDGLDVSARLEKLGALIESQDRQVEISGDVSFEKNIAKLSDGVIATGASRLELPRASLAIDSLKLEAQLSGEIAAAEVPVEGWRSAVAPSLSINGVAGESLEIAGTVGLGGGVVTIERLALAERLEARLSLASIDPGQVHASAPAGSISSETIAIDMATDFAPQRLRGEVTLPITGTLQGEELGAVTATAAVDTGRFSARIDADSPRGAGRVEASGNAFVSDWVTVVVIENARARGELASVAALVPGLRARSARVDARARGPLSSLAVSGSATLTRVAWQDSFAAGRAFARVELSRLDALAASRPALGGRFRAELDAPRFAGTGATSVVATGKFSERRRRVSGRVEVTGLDRLERGVVEADVELGEVITAQIRSIDARAGGLAWRGRGGQIRVAGERITTPRPITIASSAGTVTAGADIRPGQTRITATIDGFDVRRSRSLHGIDTVRAVIDGELELTLHGDRILGSVSAKSDSIAVDGAPPVSAEIAATLGADRLELTASAGLVGGGGDVRLELATRRPGDVTDPAAWLALGIADLQRVDGSIRGVDARTVERLLGRPIEATGRVAAELKLPYEGRQALGLEIDVERGRYAGIGGLGGRIRASWDAREIKATATVQQGGTEFARVDLGLAAPLRVAWRDPGSLINRPMTGAVSVSNLSLRRIERLRLVDFSLGGFVTATATATGTLADPRFEIKNGRAARLELAGMSIPKLFIDASYRGDEIRGRLAGTIRGGGRFEAEAGFKIPSRALEVEVNARALRLTALRPLAPDPDHPLADIGGQVDITGLVLSVDPASMRASGRIQLREGRVLLEGGARAITDINATLILRGDRVRLARLVAKNNDGQIAASGEVRFAGYTPAAIDIDVTADDIPYVAGSYLASIDLNGKITGRYADGVLALEAPIRTGRIELSDTGRQLQNIGELEDVVFTDAKARARRKKLGATPTRGLRTVVKIDLSRGVRVVMKEVDAVVVGSLEAIFVAAQMTSLTGQLRAREGRVQLFERRYQLVRAEATFDGPLPMNPDLDIEITRTFPEATVTARVHGRLSQVLSESSQARHVQLTSDAGFSEEQILALMLGQNPDDVVAQDTGGSKVGGIGRAVIASEVRDILRSVGLKVDVVRFHDDGWEFGKWVNFRLGDLFSRRVLLGYRFRDSGEERENTNEGTLEVPVTPSVNLEGRVGDRGIGNIDLLWIKRF